MSSCATGSCSVSRQTVPVGHFVPVPWGCRGTPMFFRDFQFSLKTQGEFMTLRAAEKPVC